MRTTICQRVNSFIQNIPARVGEGAIILGATACSGYFAGIPSMLATLATYIAGRRYVTDPRELNEKLLKHQHCVFFPSILTKEEISILVPYIRTHWQQWRKTLQSASRKNNPVRFNILAQKSNLPRYLEISLFHSTGNLLIKAYKNEGSLMTKVQSPRQPGCVSLDDLFSIEKFVNSQPNAQSEQGSGLPPNSTFSLDSTTGDLQIQINHSVIA